MNTEPAILFINLWDSKCGVCRLGADPREECHDTTLGYYAKDAEKPEPCHVRWTHVSSDYSDVDGSLHESIKQIRPDLEFVTSWPV